LEGLLAAPLSGFLALLPGRGGGDGGGGDGG
jgi:hypothetical protein